MTISPGIYAIHRGSDAEVQVQTLYDEVNGLRLTTGPATGGDRLGVPAFTLVLRGAIETDGLGAFKRGEALVADAAAAIRATAADTKVLTVIYEKGSSLAAGVALRAHEHPEWPACDPTPAKVLLTETPRQQSLNLFMDPSRKFSSGFWRTTAYRRRSTEFPNFEVMHLLSGWIELTLDDGPTFRFEENDTYLIAKGTKCDWRTGGMAKISCALVPVG